MPINHIVFDNKTLMDLRDDTVTEDTLAEGATAHDATGAKIIGTLSVPKVVSITIANPPTKTEYAPGEYFNPAGMVVHVNYSNGIVGITSDYTYTPNAALTTNNTAITISYTEGGITVTATQAITVKKSYDATFANNSWAAIAEACATNSVPSSWVVGDSKTMTINGTSYQIDIIGKNHDTYTAGGTAPLTFQMHDSYGTSYSMGTNSDGTSTNSGGFGSSAVKTTHLPAIKALMPSEVRSAIKMVNKKNSRGNKSTILLTVSCDLFLLAEVEVFGTTSKTPSGEGSQYEYYSAGNSSSKTGPSNGWWLRSPDVSSSTSFCYVQNGNVVVRSIASGGTKDIAFAFCF